MTEKKPNLIHRFVSFILRRRKRKKLDKITNDPEYQKILDKHNIKPVDWESTKDDTWFD